MSQSIFLENNTQENTNSHLNLSSQMRAVLLIVNADPFLKQSIGHYIDVKGESIKWDLIFKTYLNSSHRATMLWAYGIWTDKLKSKEELFELSLNIEEELQKAVLSALALSWGLGNV